MKPAGIGKSLVLFLLLTLGVASCRKPNIPEDFNECTRLEILWPHTRRGLLDQLFPKPVLQETVLTAQEREYVKSLRTSTMSDDRRIQALARMRPIMCNPNRRRLLFLEPIRVVCYRHGKRLFSFSVHGDVMLVDGAGAFRYPKGTLRHVLFPSVHTMELRFECAISILSLYTSGFYRRLPEDYSPPEAWCDSIVEALQKRYDTVTGDGERYRKRSLTDERIALLFGCPGAAWKHGEAAAEAHADDTGFNEERPLRWESHYAMNPNCRPDSAGDMVLLFETKAGWNQHGGPELFAFDHHDPKGGCVLLNDGTVRFIRTEEELHALRWR